MTKRFLIKKVCTEQNRPPYSYKVDEYFERFVYENILKPFDLLGSSDRRILLSIMMFGKGEDISEGISIYEPEIIEEERIKYYPVSIHLEDVYANDAAMENIVSIYFQIISLFFLTNYKIIGQDYMLSLEQKLDWDYLLSLPYPAPFNQQKYVGD